MARELRMSITIMLTEDAFAEAADIVKFQPLFAHIQEEVGDAGKVSYEIVAPRARGDKGGEAA